MRPLVASDLDGPFGYRVVRIHVPDGQIVLRRIPEKIAVVGFCDALIEDEVRGESNVGVVIRPLIARFNALHSGAELSWRRQSTRRRSPN